MLPGPGMLQLPLVVPRWVCINNVELVTWESWEHKGFVAQRRIEGLREVSAGQRRSFVTHRCLKQFGLALKKH